MTHPNDYRLPPVIVEEIARLGLDGIPEMLKALIKSAVQADKPTSADISELIASQIKAETGVKDVKRINNIFLCSKKKIDTLILLTGLQLWKYSQSSTIGMKSSPTFLSNLR